MDYRNHSEKISLIKAGSLSLKENLESFGNRISKNRHLNCFNSLFLDEALKRAEEVEKKILLNNYGKAAGMVVAIKDVIAVKDKPLTCSSNILKGFEAKYNATVIEKLLAEDAIIIGKTNCDEFAMGSTNENSAFGPVLNPCNINYVAGGSSGGSAAAVAANLCDVALGSDTGGSIRQPAAFCGVYGLKPTYSLVSRYGLTAFASSFDSIGPFANNTEDLFLTLNIISGYDIMDSTSSKYPQSGVNNGVLDKNTKLRVGIPSEYFVEGLDEEIKEQIFRLLKKSNAEDFELIDITLPYSEYAIACYYILITAEASSNLERYDGVKYGKRESEIRDIESLYTQTRTFGFGEEVKRRIMLGTYVLSAGYYDAYYTKAQKVRRLIRNDFLEAFKIVDVIVTPTTPSTAYKLKEKTDDPMKMYLGDIYTISANLAGIPGMNIPVGKSKEGLPIGMQVMAKHFDEKKLYYFANQISFNKE